MIEVKKETVAEHGNGVRVSNLGAIYNILKNRETIKKADVAGVKTVEWCQETEKRKKKNPSKQ
jgi:hypothetical protein